MSSVVVVPKDPEAASKLRLSVSLRMSCSPSFQHSKLEKAGTPPAGVLDSRINFQAISPEEVGPGVSASTSVSREPPVTHVWRALVSTLRQRRQES